MSGHINHRPPRINPRQLVARGLWIRLALLFPLCLTAHAYRPSRPSAQELKDDAAAAKAADEAARRRAEWGRDSLRLAADKFMEARAAWLAAGRTGRATDALSAAAEAHFTLGEYRQALRLFEAAAAESRRAGDRQREQAALSSAGRALSYLGDNDRAQKYLAAAINYFERQGAVAAPPGDKRRLAEALNDLGEVFYSKGTPLKALGYFQRSLALWAEVGDRGGEASVRLNLGYALSSSGDQDGAAAQFEGALAHARAAGQRTVEALSLSAMGVVQSLRGQEQKALGLHLEALGVARASGNSQSEAVALNGLGQAYEGIGKQLVALDHYEQALRLFLANESLDFAAGTENSIARIYRLTGDDQRALAHYRRCVALSRRANKKRAEAYAVTEVAAIYRARGGRNETLGQYQRVLELYRQIGDRRGQAIALDSLGDLASESGDKLRALTFYRRALPLARASGDRESEGSTLYDAALAACDSGDLEGALGYAEQAVQLVETLRTYVAGPDHRSSYFATVHRYYGLYVDLLMRLDARRPGGRYAAAALLASERGRARSLLEIFAENGTDIRRGVEPALLERERALQQTLRDKARQQMLLSGDAETESEAAAAARELRELTAEYQLVESQIREQSPRYAALTRPAPVTLEDIQAELRDEDTALLEYSLGEERSYLWVVTATSFAGYELPGRAVIEERAREVYRLLTARQSAGGKIDAAYQAGVAAADEVYEEKALELSRMLLAPAAARLGDRRLLIVAEGVLQYIPFDALPLPGTQPGEGRPLLVSRHEVVNLPSMSALISLRRERPRHDAARGLVAVLADPVYEASDPRVPQVGNSLLARTASGEAEGGATERPALRDFDGLGAASGIPRLRRTSDEAEAIMSLVPSGRGLLATGFAASRETAVNPLLKQYQIVHFAAHGLANSEHPELSGIILSLVNEEGGRSDGLLQLQDIYNLDLEAEVVVLSACDTGLGEDVAGEGLVGLTRAFLYAGSKSVVASLWKVDDAATAELMRHFYEAMLKDGLPPAAALRSAKEAMRRQKRWQQPYYWAGFFVQGEYRQRIQTGRVHSAAYLIIPLAVFLGCIGLTILLRRRRGLTTGGGGAQTTRSPGP
jgi:CHAT domain-containing protein/tetratricopeptide (TPR) repeat protein